MATKRLEVVLAGDASGALKAMGDTESKAGGLGSKLGGLGNIAAVGFGAIAAGGAAAAVGLFKVGSDFDSAYDKIRVSTGATGDTLEALKDNVRDLGANVPSSFDDISTAVSGLNQHLGLTGTPLERLSEQMLNLSRITGTDLNTNIQDMSRLFGDWSISTDRQSGVMDELFRASQKTGVGVSELAEQVVQFGAPLRGLGFGFEESVAMLGKWQKEGVNVENVMGAMKKAFGTFSKEFGQKAPEEFRKFIDEVSKAPSASAAAAIAIDKLGVRNGPDFAAAVKEGKFAYGDLVDQIKNGTDTINGASADTEDFGEKWQKFVNRIEIAVEPLASGLFDTVGTVMESLGPILSTLADDATVGFTVAKDAILVFYSALTGQSVDVGPELGGWAGKIADFGSKIRDIADVVLPKLHTAWDDAFGAVQATIAWLGDHREILEGVAIAVGVFLVDAFIGLAAAAWSAAAGVIAATWPFLAVGAAIAAVAAGILWAYRNWGWFKTAVDAVGAALLWVWNTVLVPVGSFIIGTVIPTIANLGGKVAELATNIPQWLGNIPEALGAVVEWFEGIPGIIGGFLGSIWSAVSGWVVSVATALPGLIAGWATAFFSWIVQTAAALPGRLAYLAGFVIGWVIGEGINLAVNIAGWVTSFFSWIANVLTQLPGWLASVVANIWGWITSTAAALPGQLWQWLVQFSQWAAGLASSIGGWLFSTAASIGSWIWSTATSLPGRLLSWLDQFRDWAFTLAGRFGGWLVGAANAIWNWIVGLPGYVAGALSSAVDIGRNIVSSIWTGITNAAGWLRDRVVDFAKGVIDGVLHGLQIRSPSKVMVWAGQMMAKGIAVGFESGEHGIQQSINKVAGNIAVPLPPAIAAGSVNLGVSVDSLGRAGTRAAAAAPATAEYHFHVHVDGTFVHSDADAGRYMAGALQQFYNQGGRPPVPR